MQKSKIRKRIHFTCLIVSTFLLSTCVADHSDKEWQDNSRKNLKSIGIALRVVGQPIDQFLDCHTTNGAHVVSAEKVFDRLLRNQQIPEHVFVSAIYKKRVPPDNPKGNSLIAKWGSSYNTWCMPSEKWRLALEFEPFAWAGKADYSPSGFPIVWDKRPDLYGDVVVVLTIGGSCYSVPAKPFQSYLQAAWNWVNPDRVDMAALLEMTKSLSPKTRAAGVRLLGLRKDPAQITEIGKHLKDENYDVRVAAAWALGRLSNPVAISLLEGAMQDKEGVRVEVAKALGNIAGEATVAPLVHLLKDKSELVRREAAKALGDSKSQEAIVPLQEALDDPDPQTRYAVLDSLTRLGWSPKKDGE